MEGGGGEEGANQAHHCSIHAIAPPRPWVTTVHKCHQRADVAHHLHSSGARSCKGTRGTRGQGQGGPRPTVCAGHHTKAALGCAGPGPRGRHDQGVGGHGHDAHAPKGQAVPGPQAAASKGLVSSTAAVEESSSDALPLASTQPHVQVPVPRGGAWVCKGGVRVTGDGGKGKTVIRRGTGEKWLRYGATCCRVSRIAHTDTDRQTQTNKNIHGRTPRAGTYWGRVSESDPESLASGVVPAPLPMAALAA